MSLKARYMLYLVMWLAINFFSVAMSVPAFAGQIIYVDGDASRANNGTSWTDAYNYLQDALASATYGDEVRVAQGMYTPDHGVGLTLGNRRATFSLKNGVAVRGGFAGFGEPDPNSRDIERYKTILSGDLAGNDIDVIDPCDLRLFHLPPTRIDNSYTLLTGRNTDQATILDGFTISAGCWAGETFPGTGIGAGMHNSASSPTLLDCTFTGNICSGYGSGGMHNINDSNPTLVSCTFEKNYGCAMGNLGGDPKLIDCEFIDNFSLSNGGAMYNGGSNPTLTRCLFSDNLGGAMYNRKSSPMLDKCTFIRNSVSTRGGAIFNTDSSPTLVDCVFTENTASYYAGAVYSDGGQLTVKGCVFVKNYPGAIYNYSKTGSVFTNCTFSGNSGLGWGGAIHTYNSTFINCVFAGNRALGYRLNDGIWLSGKGGAVYYFSSYSYSMIFTNCTFSNNWADFGNSIYCYGLAYLNNCILWGSGEQIALDDPQWPQMVTMRYSDIQGNWPGEGNIDTDPCFVDPGLWVSANDPNQIAEPNDPNAVWIGGDYHLKSQAGRWEPSENSKFEIGNSKLRNGKWLLHDVTSPCIDAGDPMSPIGHEPFPNGGIVNMGTYGGTAEASKSYFAKPVCETIVAGDINGDCKVDWADFTLLALHWLEDKSE